MFLYDDGDRIEKEDRPRSSSSLITLFFAPESTMASTTPIRRRSALMTGLLMDWWGRLRGS